MKEKRKKMSKVAWREAPKKMIRVREMEKAILERAQRQTLTPIQRIRAERVGAAADLREELRELTQLLLGLSQVPVRVACQATDDWHELISDPKALLLLDVIRDLRGKLGDIMGEASVRLEAQFEYLADVIPTGYANRQRARDQRLMKGAAQVTRDIYSPRAHTCE